MADDLGPRRREDGDGGFGQWIGLVVSGLMLVVFLSAHIWAVHYASRVTVERYAFETVSARMANPIYRLSLLLLLIVGLFHGLVGVRRVIDDLGLTGAAARRLVNGTLWGAGLVGLVYGLLIFRALSGVGRFS